MLWTLDHVWRNYIYIYSSPYLAHFLRHTVETVIACGTFLSSIKFLLIFSSSRKCRDTSTSVHDGVATQPNEESMFLNDKCKISWSSPDSVDIDDTRATTSKQRRPSLVLCLLRVYGLTLLKSHLCKLVCDVLLFVGPVLQKWVTASHCIDVSDVDD